MVGSGEINLLAIRCLTTFDIDSSSCLGYAHVAPVCITLSHTAYLSNLRGGSKKNRNKKQTSLFLEKKKNRLWPPRDPQLFSRFHMANSHTCDKDITFKFLIIEAFGMLQCCKCNALWTLHLVYFTSRTGQ